MADMNVSTEQGPRHYRMKMMPKWSYFLAILDIIGGGYIVLVGLIMLVGSFAGLFGGAFLPLFLIFLVAGGLGAIMLWKGISILKASFRAIDYAASNEGKDLVEHHRKLGDMSLAWGILTIAGIVAFVIVIIAVVIMTASLGPSLY
ncbi:hypothetical protein GF359_07585 [candidate division WOR-3 bacterium]|uniref:DUF5362 domain-containing protein n=1 Tax=candidate division WOR-3 bacterium TaxID=2052148 RepID=A0A9D5K9T0_UNCW3|nr:hypothetical protein [candidate division WOR-3 bacterium]MBD3365062.1 hypothetical protein [candidate division WOR-3 bacterium]